MEAPAFESRVADGADRLGSWPGQTYTPQKLHAVAKQIYARCPRLSLHQRLISIHRPLYAPLHAVLAWMRQHSRVLDVGCGTGTLLLLAHTLVGLREGWGYDRNVQSIAIARKAADSCSLHFTSQETDYLAALRTCDTVVCCDLLHHLDAREQSVLIERIVRTMAPGARLIVKDLDSHPRWKAFANRLTDYLSTRSQVCYLPRTRLTTMLSAAGMRIALSEPLARHVWSHYLVVADKTG